MYKASITNKSNIDRAGCMQLTFDIYQGEELLFSIQTVYGNPLEVVELVKKELTKIQSAISDAESIKIPMEITI